MFPSFNHHNTFYYTCLIQPVVNIRSDSSLWWDRSIYRGCPGHMSDEIVDLFELDRFTDPIPP